MRPVNIQNALAALHMGRAQAHDGELTLAAAQVRVAIGWLQLPRDIARADDVRVVVASGDARRAAVAIAGLEDALAADYPEQINGGHGDAIKPGDVVRLRSGGPLMTVGQVFAASESARQLGQREDAAQCFWHDDDKAPPQGTFAAPALERIEVASLLHIALALWDGERADGYGEGRCFDYCQSPGGHELVEAFAAVLTEIDGKPRKWKKDPV